MRHAVKTAIAIMLQLEHNYIQWKMKAQSIKILEYAENVRRDVMEHFHRHSLDQMTSHQQALQTRHSWSHINFTFHEHNEIHTMLFQYHDT